MKASATPGLEGAIRAAVGRMSVVALLLFGSGGLRGYDCNGNELDDRDDIAEARSADCDANGIPDECELEGELAFSPAVGYPVGHLPHVVVVEDLDQDGDLDVVASDRADDTLSLLLNDGIGNFELADRLEVPDEPRGIDTGDVDRDGDTDIVCGCGHEDNAGDVPRNSVLFGEAGRFSARVDFLACTERAGALRSVSLVDFDGDEDLDIVNGFSDSDAGGVITILLGDGHGGFSDPRVIRAADPEHAGLLGGKYVAVGPVDQDALPDVVTYSGQVLFNPDGRVLSSPVDFARVADPKNVILRDLDSDGDLDAAMIESYFEGEWPRGRLRVFRNVAGYFEEAPETIVLPALIQEGLAAADLDGDGDIDLVASYNDGGVAVVVQEDPWMFRLLPAAWPVRAGVPRWLAAADLNGDRRPDLALPTSADEVAVLLNLGGRDADSDGLLDACEVPFLRGDPSDDGMMDLTDAVYLLIHLFIGGAAPPCRESADSNDDGQLDITDAVGILQYLFQGGEPPPPPGPPPGPCSLEGGRPPFLGCAHYAGCRKD